MPHAGWRSRGYLPHCDERGLVHHIVFGLADALPNAYLGRDDSAERLNWAECEFDAGHGQRLLAKVANAEIVQDCLLHRYGERYALAAWCVMPTHVHVLVEQFDGHALSAIVQGWKSFTAHAINKVESRRGPFGDASTSTVSCARTNNSPGLWHTSRTTLWPPVWSLTPATGAFRPRTGDVSARSYGPPASSPAGAAISAVAKPSMKRCRRGRRWSISDSWNTIR